MELFARNRGDIWKISDCNGTRTHNHLVRKQALNPLTNLANLPKPVWLNGWVFAYKLRVCVFESPCNHLERLMADQLTKNSNK